MRALRVPKRLAVQYIERLRRSAALDTDWRPRLTGSVLLVPIRDGTPMQDSESVRADVTEASFERMPKHVRPFAAIQAAARVAGLDSQMLPRRWERIGGVVLVRPPQGARWREDEARRIGELYGEVLGAQTVVEDLASIRGPWRVPRVRWLWGGGTETVHRENGIVFSLDVAKVMFSSGNIAERARMAGLPQRGETIVDLFAGIGYFSIPMAVHSEAHRIVACEVNPTAFRYLQVNVRLNRAGRIEPRLGDCRDVAPVGVADRIVLGHFDAGDYVDVAFQAAAPTATLHVHGLERFGGRTEGRRPLEVDNLVTRLESAARRQGFEIVEARWRAVKSYSPRVRHIVVDAVVRR